MTSLVAQMVKHLPAMQETQVGSLGLEDPLEKEMATHSSTLAWKIPWMEEHCRLQSSESQRVRHNWTTSLSLSAIRVVSSAYLRLLIFLPAISIPACPSSNPVFLMMYSAYKFNKQDENIQPWCTPFPIWHQSVVPCPVLTVASWPTYRFHRRQVSWSGIPISFKNFPQFVVIHTVKGFGVVNKAEVYVFLELS